MFAPLADDPVVTGLRHLTATCPGHPGDADQNSLDFGAAKQDFTVALVHRVVSAYYGAAGPDLAVLANRTLQALFARLTKASYDPDAAKALVDGANGPRKLALDVQIKAGKAHYDVVAPKTLSDIFSGLAFA